MTDQVRARVSHLFARTGAVALDIFRVAAGQAKRARPHVQAAMRVVGAWILLLTERTLRILWPLWAAGWARTVRLYHRLSLRQRLYTAAGLAAGIVVLGLAIPQQQETSEGVAKAQASPSPPVVERRWRMASYPSLATWSRGAETGPEALRYVEQQIATRNGGEFRSVMTVNPALMTLTEQAMVGQPMQAALYEKQGESVAVALARIQRIDALLLIDACGDEVQVKIAGLNFVRMSDPDQQGFSAMLPRRNGDFLMIRSTLSQAEVQKLVTPARLKELGLVTGL